MQELLQASITRRPSASPVPEQDGALHPWLPGSAQQLTSKCLLKAACIATVKTLGSNLHP